MITKVIVDSITTSTVPIETTIPSYIRLLANLSDSYNDTDQIIDELLSDRKFLLLYKYNITVKRFGTVYDT